MTKEEILNIFNLEEEELTKEQRKLIEELLPEEPLTSTITVYVKKKEYEALKQRVKTLNANQLTQRTSISKYLRAYCSDLLEDAR